VHREARERASVPGLVSTRRPGGDIFARAKTPVGCENPDSPPEQAPVPSAPVLLSVLYLLLRRLFGVLSSRGRDLSKDVEIVVERRDLLGGLVHEYMRAA